MFGDNYTYHSFESIIFMTFWLLRPKQYVSNVFQWVTEVHVVLVVVNLIPAKVYASLIFTKFGNSAPQIIPKYNYHIKKFFLTIIQ
jgi:hypothetical protein